MRNEGSLILDFPWKNWLGHEPSGTPRAVYRHGGFATRDAGRWQWHTAPFRNARSVCWQGDDLWLTSADGLLWQRRGGTWSSTEYPELRYETGRLLVRGGQVLLFGRLLFVLEAGKLRSVGDVSTSYYGAPRLAESACALVLYDERNVFRYDGTFKKILRSEDLPKPAHSIRAAQPADGGVWIVDDAGALHQHIGGLLRTVRPGRVLNWQRHAYPDPVPDDYDNRVRHAAVSAAGTVATWRYYDYGRTESHGLLTVVRRDGTVISEGRQDGVTGLFFDANDRLLLGEAGGGGSFERGFDDLPHHYILDFRDDEVTFDFGGQSFSVRAPRASSDEPEVEGSRGPLIVGQESWEIEAGALKVSVQDVVQRVALPGDARPFALFERPLAPPLIVDTTGGQHVFTGAAFVSSPCGFLNSAAFLVKMRGELLRVASRSSVAELPVLPPASAVEPFALTPDPGRLREILPNGITFVQGHVLKIGEAAALRSLSAWSRKGRTQAGLELATLLCGPSEGDIVQAYPAIAARVMAAYADPTRFFTLHAEDTVIAWAAVLSTHTLLLHASSEGPRVLETLRRRSP